MKETIETEEDVDNDSWQFTFYCLVLVLNGSWINSEDNFGGCKVVLEIVVKDNVVLSSVIRSLKEVVMIQISITPRLSESTKNEFNE